MPTRRTPRRRQQRPGQELCGTARTASRTAQQFGGRTPWPWDRSLTGGVRARRTLIRGTEAARAGHPPQDTGTVMAVRAPRNSVSRLASASPARRLRLRGGRSGGDDVGAQGGEFVRDDADGVRVDPGLGERGRQMGHHAVEVGVTDAEVAVGLAH